MILGHDSAVADLLGAWRSSSMHHAWLLAGPRGVGKATFARAAAIRILAQAAGHIPEDAGLDVDPDAPTARFIDGKAHPDFRYVERGMNKTGTALARNITVDQVRELGSLFDSTPALSDWRVAIIDSVDDLEPGGANALLKMLEEPPSNCLFLLVTHVPGRLLATIRSRCRTLNFQALGDDVMASIADIHTVPHSLIGAAGGSPGNLLSLSTLDLEPLRREAFELMRQGDPSNARRSKLAQSLSSRSSADRYAAFLGMVPAMIAFEARSLDGEMRLRALDAYEEARSISRMAPRLSLDPATTAFRMGSILASVAPSHERV